MTTHHHAGSPTLCYGEGPPNDRPLLLLHGVTRCWREWEELLPELTKHWQVFALDQRGHGGSGRAERYLVTDYVADAVRFLREVVGEAAIILGHSLGGMVATGLAAAAPELVRAIILEDPPFHTMGVRIIGTAWEAQFSGMRAVGRQGGTIEALADALAEIRIPVSGGAWKRFGDLRPRAALLWSAECLQMLDPEVLSPVIAGRWLEGFDVADAFARIRCPALFLQADPAAGGTLEEADLELAVGRITDCQILRFPQASHQIHRDQLQLMLGAIREFLAGRAL